MISILIVDDDIAKISSIITAIHENYQNQVEIKQASNVQEAIEVLQNNHFHLLITDLLMPLRYSEQNEAKGGETLIKEIYKGKNKAHTPIYIVGLTQFDDIQHNFSGIWKVWKYDSSSMDWRNKIRDLIFHISKIDSKIIKEKKETLFVEGITDKSIIELALSFFYKEYFNKITIETVSFSGGASWVERKLIIWSKTLFWKDSDKKKYLKAVGLFDNDEAGIKCIESLREQVKCDSAESRTFSIIKLELKYAKHLISLHNKGLSIPITLEELYPPFCWEYADKQNWLTDRRLSEKLINKKANCNINVTAISKYISSLEFTDCEMLYLTKTIKADCKENFANYIRNMDVEQQKIALNGFQLLIEDILSKLKI